MSDSIPASTPGSEPTVIPLCARLTSDEAAKLHQALTETDLDGLVIDASAVDFLGAAGLQVLMSAVRTADRDQKALRIVEPSEGFLSGLDRLGAKPADLSIEEAAPCL